MNGCDVVDALIEATVTEIIGSSGNHAVTQVAADMGDEEQPRALASRVLAEHDRLDVLTTTRAH